MPIKKRVINEVSGQHPLLRAGRKSAILFRYIQAAGDKGTTSYHLKQQPVFHPQLLADLVNEGLVTAKDQPASVSPYKLYHANKDAEGLKAKTELTVQIEVYENSDGKLGVKCLPQDTLTNIVTDGAIHIHSKTVKFKVPRRSEYAGSRVLGKVTLDADDDLLDDTLIIQQAPKGPTIIEGVASRKVKSETGSVRHTRPERKDVRGLLTYSPNA